MRPSRKIILSILDRASQNELYLEALEAGLAQYQLKSYNILKLNPEQVLSFYDYICGKLYQNPIVEFTDDWYENQLRIYVWLLVVYTHLEQRSVREMNSEDWRLFTQIFNSKNPDALEFQSLCLLKRRKTLKWSQEETNLLIQIIEEKEEKNKWNQIAKRLFIRSDQKYFRTPKQCRQHWINHLDPSKIKSKWTYQEDYQIFVGIAENGKKWSKIGKALGGTRTQHMVKNRYNSLIRKQIKKLGGQIGQQFLISKIKQRLQSYLLLNKLPKNTKKTKTVKSKKNSPSSSKHKDQSCLGMDLPEKNLDQAKIVESLESLNCQFFEEEINYSQKRIRGEMEMNEWDMPEDGELWPWRNFEEGSEVKGNTFLLEEQPQKQQIDFFFSEPAYPNL